MTDQNLRQEHLPDFLRLQEHDSQIIVRYRNSARMRHVMEGALKKGHLTLHYQPIVSSAGEVLGVEALIRIQDPERGLLSPADFYAALDHHSFARTVGLLVMDTAFRQGESWHQQGLALRMSVNISTHHLLDNHFLEDIQTALARYPGLPPERVEIEITESAPLYDMVQAQERLRACNRIGVRVALDDFGTGNASLTYLQQLPAQSVKLDRSFVRDMVDDPKDLAIVTAVITASRMLGLDVIAEGVETTAHARLLTRIGCSHLQGYLFSRPVPAEDIPDWIARFRSIPAGRENIPSVDILPTILEGHALRTEKFLMGMREHMAIPEHILEDDAADLCHLGRWLRGDGMIYYGQQPEFSGILARHERIHAIARTAKALLDAGNHAEVIHLGDALEMENRLMIGEINELVRERHTPSVDYSRRAGASFK